MEFEFRIDPPPSLTEFLFTFLFCPRESERRWEKVKIYGKRLCGRSRVKNLKAFLGHTLPLSSNGKHFSKKSVFVSIKLDQAWLDVVNILKFGSTNIILKGEISDWKSGGIDILRSLKDLLLWKLFIENTFWKYDNCKHVQWTLFII